MAEQSTAAQVARRRAREQQSQLADMYKGTSQRRDSKAASQELRTALEAEIVRRAKADGADSAGVEAALDAAAPSRRATAAAAATAPAACDEGWQRAEAQPPHRPCYYWHAAKALLPSSAGSLSSSTRARDMTLPQT